MLKLDKNNEEQQMTVMNIFVNIITDMLTDIFWKLTTNMGVVDEAKPLINMKSELTKWLLHTVMYVENSFNCWDGNKSASKISNMKNSFA